MSIELYRGRKLDTLQVKVIGETQKRALEEYETKRAIAWRMGQKINPSAREDDLFLFRLMLNKIVGGKVADSEIIKIVSALPTTVGGVLTMPSELGNHYDLFWTHRKGIHPDGTIEYFPVALTCKNPDSRMKVWELWDEVYDRLDDNPSNHGYRQAKTDGAGFYNCPGWAEREVTRKGSEIVNVTVTKAHPCTSVVKEGGKIKYPFASEVRHAWRCPTCKAALDRYMGKRGSGSKGVSESKVVRMSVLRKKLRFED